MCVNERRARQYALLPPSGRQVCGFERPLSAAATMRPKVPPPPGNRVGQCLWGFRTDSF